MEEESDYNLIRQYLAGNQAGFEILYRRHGKRLYGYLNGLLPGDRAEVDDLFQQTWLKVIDSLGQYRDQGCFTAWLFRIGKNQLIDRQRRVKRTRDVILPESEDTPEPGAPAGSEPWRVLDEEELATVLGRALAGLPPEQREVFLLRREERSFKEIAAMQNCSINTVLARMQYALKNLRSKLSEIDRGGLLQ